MVRTYTFDGSLGAKPGQFVMLWLPGVDEKPFSVAFDDGSETKITFFAVGPMSEALEKCKEGDLIGLRGPFVALTSLADSSWSVLQRINKREVEQVIVVTANAKTKSRPRWDEENAAPGLLDVLGFVATGPMDNFSFDTVQLIANSFGLRRQAWSSRQSCRTQLRDRCGADLPGELAPVALHAVEISFDDLVDDDRLRLCMEALPTNFSLPAPTVDLVRQVARHLLVTSSKYRKAMEVLEPGWEPPTSAIDPDLVDTVCPR